MSGTQPPTDRVLASNSRGPEFKPRAHKRTRALTLTCRTKSGHQVTPQSGSSLHSPIPRPHLSHQLFPTTSAELLFYRPRPNSVTSSNPNHGLRPEGKPHSFCFYSYTFYLFSLSIFFDNLWDCLSQAPHLLKYISENCPKERGSLSPNDANSPAAGAGSA